MNLKEKLVNLEPGDPISYKVREKLEQSNLLTGVEVYYQDSVGYIEGWRIGQTGEIVIDALNGSPMVRKSQHIEDELENFQGVEK